MFKKKSKDVTRVEDIDKSCRKVVTETVEAAGGVQTTRTTIITSSRDDMDSAFKNFNLDTTKLRTSGSCVTKKIVYSSSSGQKEVVEETIETYENSEQPKSVAFKEIKNSKPFTERLGFKSSKPKDSQANVCSSGATSEKITSKKALPSVKPGKFEDDCLKSHNTYRAKHGVPSMKLSKQLCAYSKEWADHLAATDTFQHRSERKYGENIFMKWSSDPTHVVTGSEAVESWYSEIKDHIFGREPTSLKSGHFTQVIWKESTELGVAWARSRSGKILVVANYDPAGNFIGKFAVNVPPPKK